MAGGPSGDWRNDVGGDIGSSSGSGSGGGRWRSQRQKQQDSYRDASGKGDSGRQRGDSEWRSEGNRSGGYPQDRAQQRNGHGHYHNTGRTGEGRRHQSNGGAHQPQQKDWGGPPRDAGAAYQRVATMAGDRVRGAWVFNAESGSYSGEDGYEEVANSAGMVWALRTALADGAPGERPDGGRSPPRPAACVYYQDVRRMYKFHCGAEGLRLLTSLVDAKHRVLQTNKSRIESAADGADRLRREGERMYVNKANLEKNGVTWSHQEYAHLGLQKVYLQTKCYQRFTETYNLMDRMRPVMLNVLRDAWRDGGTVRVSSIGGGPGFELHAVREWIRSNGACVTDAGLSSGEMDARMDLISLDLQGDWASYASQLGLRFVGDWDLRRGDLIQQCGGQTVHIAIISYVLIYTSEESTADMLAELLRPAADGGGGVRALMISERAHRQPIVSKMQSRDVDVIKLMPQNARDGVDERQLLVLPRGGRRLHNFSSPERSITFENVPYAKGS